MNQQQIKQIMQQSRRVSFNTDNVEDWNEYLIFNPLQTKKNSVKFYKNTPTNIKLFLKKNPDYKVENMKKGLHFVKNIENIEEKIVVNYIEIHKYKFDLVLEQLIVITHHLISCKEIHKYKFSLVLEQLIVISCKEIHYVRLDNVLYELKKKFEEKFREIFKEKLLKEKLSQEDNDNLIKKFTKVYLIREAICLYYRDQGKRLTNLSKCNREQLFKIIIKRDIKLYILAKFYNLAVENAYPNQDKTQLQLKIN